MLPQTLFRLASPLVLVTPLLVAAGPDHQTASKPFHGVKVNGGTVACSHTKDGLVLTLSDDFVVPDTPAPHWQVVDSAGNAYLLQRLEIKGDVVHRSIEVPSYVPDVAKVQIWCAWAEALLGETDLVCAHAVVAPNARTGGPLQSTNFEGPKANQGYATASFDKGRVVLALSSDFVIPDTPAPHWQVVDSRGDVFLLNRLKIKDDVENRRIVLPTYVRDVAKVQIWCAWAETLLGEAVFERPVGPRP